MKVEFGEEIEKSAHFLAFAAFFGASLFSFLLFDNPNFFTFDRGLFVFVTG